MNLELLDASYEFTGFMIETDEFDEDTLDAAIQAFHLSKFGFNDAKLEEELLEIFNNYKPSQNGKKETK